MRYFYDCEFIEDGREIELVSIGIAAEDGRKYYAVNRHVRWERLHGDQFSWIRENVWKHLPTSTPKSLALDIYHPDVKSRKQIANEVKDFILIGYTFPAPGYENPFEMGRPQLWADYGAYDHVALCQLWGRMIDLPEGMPMRTNDIIQLAESLGVSENSFPEQNPATVHHALHDAIHNMEVFNFLNSQQPR